MCARFVYHAIHKQFVFLNRLRSQATAVVRDVSSVVCLPPLQRVEASARAGAFFSVDRLSVSEPVAVSRWQ